MSEFPETIKIGGKNVPEKALYQLNILGGIIT